MARVRFRLVSALLAASLVAIAALPASAQPQGGAGRGVGPAAAPATPTDAVGVRRELMSVLKLYPPALGRVLKLDPSLFNNDAYLAPYPGLVAYLNQHPEIKRDPAFYLEQFDSDYYGRYRSEAARMWEDMMTGVFVLVIIVALLGSLGWVVRTLIDYRRWHRLSKTQTEVHGKLLDRFTANDELIAYVQSPAGNRFLQSAPITLDPGARTPGAPFGRILWSIQAGLVLAAAGMGLYYVSGRVTDVEMTQPLYTMGVLALSLGIGFVLAAVVSFMLSKRLGLFEPPATTPIVERGPSSPGQV
jgi:hypothetical protein